MAKRELSFSGFRLKKWDEISARRKWNLRRKIYVPMKWGKKRQDLSLWKGAKTDLSFIDFLVTISSVAKKRSHHPHTAMKNQRISKLLLWVDPCCCEAGCLLWACQRAGIFLSLCGKGLGEPPGIGVVVCINRCARAWRETIQFQIERRSSIFETNKE